MSDAEQIKILADQMWGYFKPKVEKMLQRNIQFFRAKVVSNQYDGTLEVEKPFDTTTLTLPCTSAVSDATVGQQVLAFVFGSLSNAVVVASGKLEKSWNKQELPQSFLLYLRANRWNSSDKTQSVDLGLYGYEFEQGAQVLSVMQQDDIQMMADLFIDNGIRYYGQFVPGYMTFKCDTIPSSDVPVRVTVQKVRSI